MKPCFPRNLWPDSSELYTFVVPFRAEGIGQPMKNRYKAFRSHLGVVFEERVVEDACAKAVAYTPAGGVLVRIQGSVAFTAMNFAQAERRVAAGRFAIFGWVNGPLDELAVEVGPVITRVEPWSGGVWQLVDGQAHPIP